MRSPLRWFKRRSKRPDADPELPRTVLGAMREDRGRFAGLTGARVLVYWPHGLGDWVHLGAIAPLFEPSNRYAVLRFGDDYVALMEGNPLLAPVFSGVLACGDGADRGARHLGITLERCDGGKTHLALPPPIDEAMVEFAPEALLWSDYPETEGRTPFPFHTKARNLARLLVAKERLAQFDLAQPLRNSIDFTAPPETQRRVDERLAAFAPPGTRVAILSRTGVTAARKNWGDADQARALVEGLRREDPRWRVVSMDGEALGEGMAGFRALFADMEEPFARVYKALLARADLFVGVPAGPLHVAMARGGVPIVGLWLAHHPDWYDEPNPAALHLIGSYVRERGFHRRPATRTKPPSLAHRLHYCDDRTISTSELLEAVSALLAARFDRVPL